MCVRVLILFYKHKNMYNILTLHKIFFTVDLYKVKTTGHPGLVTLNVSCFPLLPAFCLVDEFQKNYRPREKERKREKEKEKGWIFLRFLFSQVLNLPFLPFIFNMFKSLRAASSFAQRASLVIPAFWKQWMMLTFFIIRSLVNPLNTNKSVSLTSTNTCLLSFWENTVLTLPRVKLQRHLKRLMILQRNSVKKKLILLKKKKKSDILDRIWWSCHQSSSPCWWSW